MFSLFQRFYTSVRWRGVALVGKAYLTANGVRLGKGVRLYGQPLVSCVGGSEIHIGARVVLCSSSSHTALGVNHPVVLRTLRPGARISIGDDVGISGGSICAAVGVAIGSQTMCGANVTIADTDFHPLAPQGRRYSRQAADAAAIRIGRNVFIGTNSIVLKGVEIGDNSIIGAGSIVTRSIPANVIAAGSPCRVLRALPEGSEPLAKT